MKKTVISKACLAEIADIRTGYVFRSGVESVPDGNVLVLGMKDVRVDRGIQWDTVPLVRASQDLRDYALRDGDIVFTVRGARFFGACVEGVSGLTIASHHLFHIRVKDEALVRPVFLAWFLNRVPAQRYYAEHAAGQTGLRGLRRQDMMHLPVSIPPPDRQDAIMRAVNCMRREVELFEASIQNRLSLQDALAADL